MSEPVITYQTGVTESIDALLATINMTDNTDCWSWYEPKPESLIGKDIKLPLCTLQKGKATIEEDIQFSEYMLFYADAGITLTPNKLGKFDYFYWTENDIVKASGSIKTHKETADAYLRNADILKQQFNIPEDRYPDLKELEKLKMIKYYDNDHCIAWTITEGK